MKTFRQFLESRMILEKITIPTKDGKINTKKFTGPSDEAVSDDAVVNPLYKKDKETELLKNQSPPHRIEFERTPVVDVSLDKIRSPQKSLNPNKINILVSNYDDKAAPPIHLVQMPDGRYILANGNHRAVASIILGRSKIKAHVIKYKEK